MNEPLDEQYLRWLYHQVASVRLKNPARTYWSLLRQLYVKEYIWIVPNDDNRVEDGRDLRHEFFEECHVAPDHDWAGLPCSMLEMLIGLSRRLAFEDEGGSRDWFWHMLDNLELSRINDGYFDRHKEDKMLQIINEIADRLIWRQYDQNGSGGLFPLNHPTEDQRDVELWYQMSAYLLERA